MKTALFWAITQPFRDILSGLSARVKNQVLGWDGRVVPKLRYEVTTTHCVIARKSAFLIAYLVMDIQ